MKRYLLVLLIYAIVLFLSLTANPNVVGIPLFKHADKVAHFGFYAFITFVSYWSLKGSTMSRRWKLCIIVGVPILFGGYLEIMQSLFFSPRTGDWYDFAANTCGVIIGYYTARMLLKR
ncbi:MAG: VanZ family protein [Bacteroidales bacterium]